jgi:hypothetical protein
MKTLILKTLNIIRWISVGCLSLTFSFSSSVALQLSIEEGGAPGYDPEAIFISHMIVAAVSLPLILALAFLEPIATFFRHKYLWWRSKIAI